MPVVSEVDLFLRLCPAVTIGVTGTKGKTTTARSSRPCWPGIGHPVLLGGNIGTPLVERLPELTARHRVVVELSELQLPTLSRGTDVSGLYPRDLGPSRSAWIARRLPAVKRLLAELATRDRCPGAQRRGPVVSRLGRGQDAARVVRYRRDRPTMGGIGVRTAGSWRTPSSR